MDAESLNLVALSHDVYARHTADYYAELRSRLDNRLGGMALEAVREAADAAANRELLKELVSCLPKCDGSGNFHVDNQADVRLLQSSVIWTNQVGSHDKDPYYIIGEAREGKRTSLLLHGATVEGTGSSIASGNAPTLMIGNMRASDYQQMRVQTHDNLYQPLSLEETNTQYQASAGVYLVGSTYPPGNTMVADGASSVSLVGQLVRYLTAVPRIKTEQNLSQAIPGETLARLHAVDHLNHLSVAFNSVSQFQQIMQRQLASVEGKQLTLFES